MLHITIVTNYVNIKILLQHLVHTQTHGNGKPLRKLIKST